MKIEYVSKRFSADSLAIVERADAICEEYANDGFVITLRQLYYQFVARGVLANTEQNYRRLGALVNDGRLAGLIDWDHLEDRTRNLRSRSAWTSPESILHSAAQSYHRDWWKGQKRRVEVWVEKEALAQVVERAATANDVPYFCCRGFVSQSEMHAAAMRLREHEDSGAETHVLYLGDHDPSGIEMTNDVARRLIGFGARTLVHRIALTMEQVDEINPPPNPAKATDSRFASYQAIYGDESWELDALDPHYLIGLIAREIDALRDNDLYVRVKAREAEEKRKLERIANAWNEIAKNY